MTSENVKLALGIVVLFGSAFGLTFSTSVGVTLLYVFLLILGSILFLDNL